MSTIYNRKVKTTKGGTLNISKSGLSHSQKVGKFTFNSNGRVSYNSSIKGLSFKMNIFMALIFIPTYWHMRFLFFITIKLPFILVKFTFNQVIKLIKRIATKQDSIHSLA